MATAVLQEAGADSELTQAVIEQPEAVQALVGYAEEEGESNATALLVLEMADATAAMRRKQPQKAVEVLLKGLREGQRHLAEQGLRLHKAARAAAAASAEASAAGEDGGDGGVDVVFEPDQAMAAGFLARLSRNAVNAYDRLATHGNPRAQLVAWQAQQVEGRGKVAFVRAMALLRLAHKLLFQHRTNLGVVVLRGA